MGPVHLTLDEVRDLARRCLEANGCDSTNARAVAATIKRAEADGSAGHGLLRLPGYVASLRVRQSQGRRPPARLAKRAKRSACRRAWRLRAAGPETHA